MSSTVGMIDIEDDGLKQSHVVSSEGKIDSKDSSALGRPQMQGKEGMEIKDAITITPKLTSDVFFGVLSHVRSEKFAIEGNPEQTPIWICNREDKIMDVLNGMIKRNILAVPVVLKSQKYFGFLDMLDIVKYVVSHFGTSEFQSEKDFLRLLKEEKNFSTKTVADLMEAPTLARNMYHPVHAGYSAMAVVEALAREKGLHRVPVVTVNREIVNLVTQSQVVRFLARNHEILGKIADAKVGEFKNLFHEVLAVKESAIAIEGFNLMAQHDVQGIAVVNDEGRLKGNLSLRDLKILGHDMNLFWRLHQTVKNFIIKLRHEYQARHGRPRNVVYVIPETPIRAVIEALVSHSVHRLYICDTHHDKKVVGVITLQDLLAIILDH